jgi:hypothetical protein
MKPTTTPTRTPTEIFTAELEECARMNVTLRRLLRYRLRRISQLMKSKGTHDEGMYKITEEITSIMDSIGSMQNAAGKILLGPRSVPTDTTTPTVDAVMEELTKGKSKLR